ncbi:MAG: sigma-70 family RNA polymerase sigma factor [Ruminococcaceae bacterium]|nr:sigma-70 family RNA polymerase sigma factor [Oscillospiraceae bacterium]
MQPFCNFKGIISKGGLQLKEKTAVVSDQTVIETYFNMVYKLALSQTKNKTSADDVTQEVFLRYLKHSAKFESDEHRKAWLIRVTLNCSKNVFSNAWFQKTVPLSEELVFEEQETGEVYYAVLELPVKYRSVIHLFYYENLSVEEIASVLGKPPSTIKSQLFRGREMLRSKLKGGDKIV